MRRSLFEQYGGFARVNRVVASFYDKVLESPVVGHYFHGIDMKRLIDHQTKFIASLMGGPASYTNEQLERAHEGLGITEPAFREVIELLRETLEEFDFENEHIQQIEDAMMSRKAFVISRD